MRPLGLQLGVLLLEGVGDVLEEDQPEDDVLVLTRIHRAAQRVRSRPELRLDSPGSIEPRSASAAAQSFASKPRVAPLFDSVLGFFSRAIRVTHLPRFYRDPGGSSACPIPGDG